MFTASLRRRSGIPAPLSRRAGRLRARRREAWSFRASLESLEPRLVLSTLSWVNPQGGDWSTASNWSGGHVPTIQDDVRIDIPGISITHASTLTNLVHSVSSVSPIVLSRGTLELEAPSDISSSLTLAGGNLRVKADLTVGSFTWTGGNMSGSGLLNATNLQVGSSDWALAGATIGLSPSGLSLQGTATLPVVGSVQLSGTVRSAASFILTAAPTAVKVGGFSLTNDVVTLTSAGLSLQGDATLPLIGGVHFAGAIKSDTDLRLTATVPAATIGGFSFANSTIVLDADGLSIQGTATLPAIGKVLLSGPIKSATDFNLTAANVPTVTIGGVSLTNDTVTLDPAGLSLQGDATLPLIGGVHFAGLIKSAADFSLTAAMPTATIGGFSFANSTIVLDADGLSIQGTATLPVIGGVLLSGPITDDADFSLSATLRTATIGGFSLANSTIVLDADGLSLQGTATLPMIGGVLLAGSIKSPTIFNLTASVPATTIGAFLLTDDTVTLDASGLSFQGTATLPMIGRILLSGSIKSATNFSLTAAPAVIRVGAFSLTHNTIVLNSAGLSLQGNATLPLIGGVHFAGYIADAANFSLVATVPTVAIGGYSLTNDTVTLDARGLSLKGTATLPVIGRVLLSGPIRSATVFSLTAALDSVRVGSFTLTNDTVVLNSTGLLLKGDATLPVIGGVMLSGSIRSATDFRLIAPVPTVVIGGYTLTGDTIALDASGVSLKGTATLPVIGGVVLSGFIRSATNFNLTAAPAYVRVGAFPLTNNTVTLNYAGLSLQGNATLPLIGGTQLAGPIKSDSDFSLTATLPAATISGFSFANSTILLNPAGLSLKGTATLPAIGKVTLSGPIKSAANYDLTADFANLKMGGFAFIHNTVTLANGILGLKGTAILPVVGAATLSGTITDVNHYSLTGSIGDLTRGPFTISTPSVTLSDSGGVAELTLAGKVDFAVFGGVNLVGPYNNRGTFSLSAPVKAVTLLDGLVNFSSMTVTMTVGSRASAAVGMSGQGTVAKLGTVQFAGAMTDQTNYSLTGTTAAKVAGFSVDAAHLTLGTKTLGANFTIPVPEIGNVTFNGSYGPGAQWSLGATYPGTVRVGPVTLSGLSFVLSTQRLTLFATGSVAGLESLVNMKVIAQIFSDGRFQMLADAPALQLGAFSLGQAIITVGNDNPQKTFQISVHTTAGFPKLGAGMTLDGIIVDADHYDLTGKNDLSLAGLTVTSVKAELSSSTGFTFKGIWKYGGLTTPVSGTIQGDGRTHFEGNVASGARLGGFIPTAFDAIADLDPTHGAYSIDVTAKLNVFIASLDLQAHSSKTSQGWDPLVLAASAPVGGALAAILSGTANFTVDPSGVSFAGKLNARNGLGSFDVSGKIFSNGAIQIGDYLGKAGPILAQDAANILNGIGANAGQIAGVLKSAFRTADKDVAGFLHGLNFGASQIADALQSAYKDNLGQLANAIWGVVTNNLSEYISALADKADNLSDLVAVVWNNVKATDDLGSLFITLWQNDSVNADIPGLIDSFIDAGVLTDSSYDVADFLLNQAGVGLATTAKGLSDWLGGDRVDVFWAIALGAGRSYTDAVSGLIGAGLLVNSYSDVSNFVFSQLSPSDATKVLNDLF